MDETSPREEYLPSPGAGGGTVRLGNTTRRVPERTSAAMCLVLDHLRQVGFQEVPRILGTDERGRLILSYLDGHTALPPYGAWVASPDLLSSVAELLRRYHEAISGLCVPDDFAWPTKPPPKYTGKIVGHMDVSLANVVCRGHVAVGLIDFEEVGAAAPLWDVARTVRHWIPLIDPQDLRGGLRDVNGKQAARLRIFADSYGLSGEQRADLLDAVLMNADYTFERMRSGAAAGHPGYTREWTQGAAERNRRARRWIESQQDRLTEAL